MLLNIILMHKGSYFFNVRENEWTFNL